jgi:DNA polymerase III subunit delta
VVLFFYGPNTYASRRKLRQVAETYVKKSGADFGPERIDGEVVTAEELNATLGAVPFLTSSRLVIVEGLSRNKKVSEQADKLISRVPDTTVAAFYETEVDQRSTYFKTMLRLAKPVKFDFLSGSRLSEWVKAEAEETRGGSIEPAAVRLLIEICGDDQWRLEQEIAKLVNFNRRVTAESVKQMVEAGHDKTIFDLVEAMTAGNAKQALVVYRRLISDRMNELYILTMITWQLRNLLLAKTAGPVTARELAKLAGMSPYVAGKALDKRKDFEEEVLRKAFLKAVETDYLVKAGEGEAEQLVESLIFKIAHQRQLAP